MINVAAISNQSGRIANIGAVVSAGQNLGLAASNDLIATTSTITAGNSAQLIAGHDINLNAATHTEHRGTQMKSVASPTYAVTTPQRPRQCGIGR